MEGYDFFSKVIFSCFLKLYFFIMEFSICSSVFCIHITLFCNVFLSLGDKFCGVVVEFLGKIGC